MTPREAAPACCDSRARAAAPPPPKRAGRKGSGECLLTPVPAAPPLAAGVESFDIDLEAKKVTVRGSLEPGAVVEVVAKSGKATELW